MAALVLVAVPARAQATDPIGPFVVDVRGLMAGLPTAAGWTPGDLAEGAVVPSRGYGLEGGAHVYVGRLGAARIGVGGALGLARGTALPAESGLPDVIGRVTTLAPQLSFNFGQRLGWSYLSAGYGGTRFESEASATTDTEAEIVSSGWVGTLNFGGGARWFLTEHVGVGFDARWHRISSRDATATAAAALRTSLFHLAVGVSIQ